MSPHLLSLLRSDLSFTSAGVKVSSKVSSWLFVVNAIGMRSGDRTCSVSGLRHVRRKACEFGVRASSNCETCLVSLVGRVVSVIVLPGSPGRLRNPYGVGV